MFTREEVKATMNMKAILKYPGAKNRIAAWITKYIPKHKVYCEPFFGSGAVFFNKQPCYNEILNDIDDDIYNFFKVLRTSPTELAEAIRNTPYCRTEYNTAYVDGADDEVEKARIFAVKCWQGFGCGNRHKNGFRRGIGSTSPNPAKAWNELPDTLRDAAERIKNAQIEHKDAIELIKSLKGENTFIYVDPPYLLSTRKANLYNHELDDEYHKRLLRVICDSDCKIMISGYDNELYNEYLKDWNKLSKNTTAECSVKRTETIWMNYEYDAQVTFSQEGCNDDTKIQGMG